MHFHENLKAARTKFGLSQEAVAMVLGISRGAYCAYEQNRSTPNPGRIVELCKLFNTSPNVLLSYILDSEMGRVLSLS